MADGIATSLKPLPYHTAIRDFLKTHDREVWKFFVSRQSNAKAWEEQRFDLLKTTYRLGRETHETLHNMAEDVALALGILVPITIYQAQNPVGLNASLAFIPDELHIVLHGDLLNRLSPAETRALLGHEIGHYVLWSHWSQELRHAWDLLVAFCQDPHAHPSYLASLNLYQLYSEIFCDRAAYLASENLDAVVSMLVKVATGVSEVNATDYLKQAREVLERESTGSDAPTHPEVFIRSRAVELFAEHASQLESQVAKWIEGPMSLDHLDLLQQQRLSAVTRQVLESLLTPKWFQTELTLAHARLYFNDFQPKSVSRKQLTSLSAEIARSNSIRDYLCFVLMDFATADRDLDELPLAACLEICEILEIKEQWLEHAKRDLKLRKNQLEKIDQTKDKILAKSAKVSDRGVVS